MKLKFLTAIIAGMAILLPACSDENESTLDINTIQGRATIEGKVLYNSGDIFEIVGETTTVKNNNYLPIGDKTVYLNLDLKSLGDYDGKLVYTTTTAADGTFSIDVPANAKGIKYTIHIESFKATKNEYTTTTTPASIVPKTHYFTNTDVASLTAYENIGDYKEIELDNSTEIQ